MGCEYLSMELREREVLEYCEHEQFLLGQVNFELLRCHVIMFTFTGDTEGGHQHCRHSPLCRGPFRSNISMKTTGERAGEKNKEEGKRVKGNFNPSFLKSQEKMLCEQ